METAERIDVLTKLGRTIANLLTNPQGSWYFVEPTDDVWSVYMHNAQGARIYLSLTHSKGYNAYDRVSVSGWQHIGKHGAYVEVYQRDLGFQTGGWTRASSPDITVAVARGAEAIAKDIAKRFLPKYLAIFAAAQRKVAEDAAYDSRITNTLKRVADAAGFTVPKLGEYDREVRREVSGKIGKVEVIIKAYTERVELKLDDLSTAQAEAVLQFLKALPKGESHGD